MEHRYQQLIRRWIARRRDRRARRSRRGVALIIVLSSIALIALLVGALLLSINSELATSSSSATNSQTDSLAANVTQLVMAQIRDGTSEGSSTSTGQQYAWASQPGMIRTYTNASSDPTQNPDKCYKLYSSDQMVVDGKTYMGDLPSNGATADYPANWYSGANASVYTDLNAPVQDVTGALNYPILDPAAMQQQPYVLGFTVSGAPTGTTTSSSFQNPIPMPVKWLYVRQNGFVTAATSGSGNTVTVPKDPNYTGTAPNPIVGRMAFWADDETCKVNINTAGEGLYWDTPRATATLASTSTPSSPPATVANDLGVANDVESFYSFFQPATHELQRYPGHPAMVALSPILGPAFAYTTALAAQNASLSGASFPFPPTPRLSIQGGSQLGTVPYNPAPQPISFTNAARKALYASVDELFFSNYQSGTSRKATDPYYSQTRPTATGTRGASINKTSLEAAKFFLTADSRAPEVNMFNLPRIACWPIDSNLTTNPASPYTSGYDRLIAFCSSLKQGGTTPEPYYFQRSRINDGSETNYDWASIARNQTLYTYLQNLASMSIPGFGGQSLASKYSGTSGTTDFNQLLTETMDYIRCTNPNDPSLAVGNQYIGNHTNFSSGTAVQWIKPLYNTVTATMGFGRTFTIREVALEVICAGDASVTPNSYGSPVTVQPTTQSAGNPYNWDGNNANNPLLQGITTPPNTVTGGPLAVGEKRYQAAIIFRVQCVSPGNGYPNADLYLQCSGLKNLSFPGANGEGPAGDPIHPFTNIDSLSNVVRLSAIGGNGAGYEGPGQTTDPRTMFNNSNGPSLPFNSEPPTSGAAYTNCVPSNCGNPTPTYFFVSQPFTIPGSSGAPASTISFGGGTFTVNLYEADGPASTTMPPTTLSPATAANPSGGSASFIQSITFNFPAKTLVAPSLDITAPNSGNANGPPDPAAVTSSKSGSASYSIYEYATNWSFNRLMGANTPVGNYPATIAATGAYTTTVVRNTLYNPHDTVFSISLASGDARLAAATRILNDSAGSVYTQRTDISSSSPFSCYFPSFTYPGNLGSGNPSPIPPGVNPSSLQWSTGGGLISYPSAAAPGFTVDVPTSLASAAGNYKPTSTGDWDNVPGNEFPPGSFINKADEGDSSVNNIYYVPYFDVGSGNSNISVVNSIYNLMSSYCTPNRLIPSPGMFGSLPTGVISQKPWQTLLFRPDRTHPESPYGTSGSQNLASWPPDHLYMDLFWMPEVEPYAISDCFSTAGKINMNYQIVPFTYITRNTALYCLIHGGTSAITGAATGEKIFSVLNTKTISTNSTNFYKNTNSLPNGFTNFSFRSDINCGSMTFTSAGTDPVGEVGGTFRQFKARFNTGDIFRSPSEICDIYLVPQGDSWSNGSSNWAYGPDGETYWSRTNNSTTTGHQATGDNDRERPYTDLYGRLTTKSNTFLVHMRVQSLKQSLNEVNTNPTQWTEGTDVVTGEYRGSSLIERYIDPADTRLVDYATPGTSGTLNDLYKFRIVYNKKFAP